MALETGVDPHMHCFSTNVLPDEEDVLPLTQENTVDLQTLSVHELLSTDHRLLDVSCTKSLTSISCTALTT